MTRHDNIFNTGLWKPMVLECIITLIQCYPSLYGHTYVEEYNLSSAGVVFHTNDILLMLMIFMRIHYLVNCILSTSFYTDPRAQRVCDIYGADANEMYAVKSIMVNNSELLVVFSTSISMIMFSYQLRLFERAINPTFFHITTAMWNIFITMSTVGYGDTFAKSHLGRLIEVVCGFWGVFLLSLFILSLMNMLNHNSSEKKAYNLLQRLLYKDDMKRQAVNMLSAAFKIQKIRKSDPRPNINEINALQRYYK